MKRPNDQPPVELLWVLADGASFAPDADLLTTEMLVRGAQADGRFRQWLTTLGRIATVDGEVSAACVPVEPARIDRVPIPMDGATRRRIVDFDCVFIRVDPPITQRFRHALIQLGMGERRGVKFVNSPTAILSRGSKLFNQVFAYHMSPGIVSADLAQLEAFLAARPEALWVAKPLDLAGGRDVHRLAVGDPDIGEKLARLIDMHGFIHLQRYLPEVETLGEVRHLVFAGRIVAAWRKVPAPGDYRANLDQGARVEALPSAYDFGHAAAIVEEVTAAERGFVFYSLDTIGPYINELNVENTGGLPNADALYGKRHADVILDILADFAAPRRARFPSRLAGVT